MSWQQQVSEKTSSVPKTSLGFFAAVAAIDFTGTALLAGTLATADVGEGLVAAVVIVGLAILVATVLTVIGLAIFAPEKLMLGQITGTEYSTITERKSGLGDSLSPPPSEGATAIENVHDAEIIEDEDPA